MGFFSKLLPAFYPPIFKKLWQLYFLHFKPLFWWLFCALYRYCEKSDNSLFSRRFRHVFHKQFVLLKMRKLILIKVITSIFLSTFPASMLFPLLKFSTILAKPVFVFGIGGFYRSLPVWISAVILMTLSVCFCRYEMSNCLFEAAFENILSRCKCAPGSALRHLPLIFSYFS